ETRGRQASGTDAAEARGGHGPGAEAAEVPVFGCVVLAARTPADLRLAVTLRGLVPMGRRIRLAVAETPPWASPPFPVAGQGDCWRHLAGLTIGRAGQGWHLDALFDEPAAGGDVLAQVVHGLFGARRHLAQPVAGLAPGDAAWRPGDANATLVPMGGPVPERRDAPGCDLLLAGPPYGEPAAPAAPAAVPPQARRTAADGLAPCVDGQAADVKERPAAEAGAAPGGFPPVDEAVINPVGFRQHPSSPVASLVADGPGFAVVSGGETLVRLPPGGEVTDVDVARLRETRALAVPALPGRPLVAARLVAALAAAGVPMLAEPDPARDAALGHDLARALAAVLAEEVQDDLRREELSIRLRRSALRLHGSVPRWRETARAAGLPLPAEPSVSILLCTRRPEMIPFAIRQMERQRGVRAELVIGLHGLSARRTAVGSALLPVTVVEAPAELPFGAVLNRMADLAAGSFLAKVDDDDWYGPDHLADLLLAQLYSGADLVGSAAEFVYLEPLDVTIRRRIGTERFAPLVAGGTMLVRRSAFEAVGGFRPLPRTVDGQLLQAVEAAGGRIYRTHGFGYVLRRRSAHGHTWRQPVQSFLASSHEQWRGLVFNELMEAAVPHGRAEVRTWAGPR
ncbi:glycosyltransferase, partial [Microbispora sp. ATCC PTA-5024]|uniref:glycosyltransferase n=1 Tax=Microbispora sp. ATCC PTA-5024 TaxID=316330 RepID=UPI0003DD179A